MLDDSLCFFCRECGLKTIVYSFKLHSLAVYEVGKFHWRVIK